jgi:L1 cell adhesion molecule like protein
MQQSIAIGFDLGTTNSAAAYKINDKLYMVSDGNAGMTPSVVLVTEDECPVGAMPKKRAAQNPRNTIFDSKRMIGRSFTAPMIQQLREFWPFTIISGVDDEILIAVPIGSSTRYYHTSEISGMILADLKRRCELRIGAEVRDAVITVPAYFTDRQRSETIKAAEYAGLNVLCLINEPSAGALAYAYERRPTELRKVIVFDFGGEHWMFRS